MNGQRPFSPGMVGGSSLLAVFSVLMAAVTALLGLSAAISDTRLNEKGLDAIRDYYAADREAEEILAALRRGIVPDGVWREDGGAYSYECPVGETQRLTVTAAAEGEAYRVLRWQLVPAAEWEADGHIRVWDGTLP